MKNFLRVVLLLLCFFSSVQASVLSGQDLKDLKAQVELRWKAIMKHDFGDSYQYESPTYRSVFTKDLYVSQFSHGIDWSLTKIRDIKYDPATSVATVIVDVETKPRNSAELSTVKAKTASIEIREKWLHIKSRWWHSSSE